MQDVDGGKMMKWAKRRHTKDDVFQNASDRKRK